MKKSCLVLVAAFAVSGLFAADAEQDKVEFAATDIPSSSREYFKPELHPVTYAELSLATPLQLPQANWMVKGVRLNLLAGESYGVTGLDLGLVGIDDDELTGVQLCGASWNDGNVSGLQLNALGEVNGSMTTGVQLSGLINYNRGDFVGLQAAALNFDGAFTGLQLGAFNYDRSLSRGFELGLININRNELRGYAIGCFNYTERLVGLQLGAFNLTAEHGSGVQLGLFNAAESFVGLQIGLLNLIGNGEMPIMPIVNAKF